MDIADNLSKQLKKRREAKGMTQGAMATKIGVNRATIIRWEAKPADTAMIKNIKAVTAAFRCEVVDILGIEPRNEHDIGECLRRVTDAATGKRPIEANPTDPNLAAFISKWADPKVGDAEKHLAVEAIGLSWIDAKQQLSAPSKAKKPVA